VVDWLLEGGLGQVIRVGKSGWQKHSSLSNAKIGPGLAR
jgi:hypothetical protein